MDKPFRVRIIVEDLTTNKTVGREYSFKIPLDYNVKMNETCLIDVIEKNIEMMMDKNYGGVYPLENSVDGES